MCSDSSFQHFTIVGPYLHIFVWHARVAEYFLQIYVEYLVVRVFSPKSLLNNTIYMVSFKLVKNLEFDNLDQKKSGKTCNLKHK